MDWLIALLPTIIVAALATAAEMLARPARADWLRNLQAWALMTLGSMASLVVLDMLGGPSLIDSALLPLWAGLFLYFLVRDCLEFLFHRAQHTFPLLWSMHSLHHSDPEMSALTTSRHYWAEPVIKALTIWPLTALIIEPTPLIFGVFSLVSLWHYVVHSRLPINLGKLSWLLNCPAYHRRHHSALPEHYNSNFASLFPIFDVVCGSYRRPDGWPPTGLDVAPESLADLICWPVRQERQTQAQSAEPALQR